ncbi:MAG: Transcriptional regulator [uncultured Propionibacteriaceae bacterium]|uniref:Transcriptional regulator n=1 Tax=uncultured Propionibacteriaceae bacterium TaxID=257457 RepID=A0A6J4NZJ1_9ACTN|nr:MAG: Transcriptional regulator [uncultured Propionibacteriaceae bacterium]
MPVERWKGPAELILAASVARRYYGDGRSKIEIADEFGLSRFKVARLLDTAREQGLVRIEISHPGTIDVELSASLRRVFGLAHAVVVDTQEDDEASLRRQLGRAAAELLSEIVTVNDVIGLAWARAVSAMATELKRLPTVPVVQLTGALSRSTGSSSSIDDSSIDIVREVARIAGGPAHLFFAPFLVPNAATARSLRQQPDVASAFDKIASVTKAVAGIGRWAPAQSTLYEAATPAEREELTEIGVCADIGGVFLAADGAPLQTSMNDRMIAISAAQMAGIAEVIAIPYGITKEPAVLAALKSGLVNSLVTHASLATALLADSPVPAGE